ncbi:MAG TPA: phosphomethylpyrimidine synthase ThiC [bacterium]|nr:phosphomethylpyrimidine synthase ThiC [bacterium]
MTQMEAARLGRITEEMKIVAHDEDMDVRILMERMARGEIVIPRNKHHEDVRPLGVGSGLRVKVNANIGTSADFADVEKEVIKARTAEAAGADAIMDLSTGGDIVAVRRAVMKAVETIIGTVPVYQAVLEAVSKHEALVRMSVDDLFHVMEQQALEGVDFFTVHCGVTLSALERLQKQGRLMDIVSRGGSFLTTWMIANERENPLYEQYDRLLDLAYEHDITLSLGDGLRPGALSDATDRAQVQELILLGELTQRAWDRHVQVIIEGPGHVPLDQIRSNIEIQKSLCMGAPFYVLGPIVTDVAPGYDHITSAIGGALAAWAGADFLCYVTPGEHLRLPDAEDVHEGVIAARIAAHAADIARKRPEAVRWDMDMSQARKKLDWESQIRLSMDPQKARRLKEEGASAHEGVCSMCGPYCAVKLVQEVLHPEKNT